MVLTQYVRVFSKISSLRSSHFGLADYGPDIVSLGRFTPRYFILFDADAVVNGIVSLISFPFLCKDGVFKK